MLQSKQLANILSQGMRSVSENNASTPIAVSLLSGSGLPLSTVIAPSGGVSTNILKVHSILAVKQLENEIVEDDGMSDWTIVDIQEISASAIIQKVYYSDDKTKIMYVIVFYTRNEFGDAVAKLRADKLCEAFKDGFKGYKY